MDQPTPPPFQPSPAKKPSAPASSTGQPLPPTSTDAAAYQDNPFMVALDGISSLFKYAKTLGIIFVVLSILGVLTNAASSISDMTRSSDTERITSSGDTMSSPFGDPNFAYEQVVGIAAVVGVIVLIAILAAIIISAIITGLRDVSAAAIAKQTETSFGSAVSTLAHRFPGYVWLQILITVKVFLWSLLLIVPGIIMAVRYSLAGTAYFARDMKASEALKYSTTVTKGAWFTTFSSIGLFNLITLGTISLIVEPSVRGTLFRQYDAYEKAHVQKPGAHWLSIVYFVLSTLLVLGFVFALVALGLFLASYYN